MESLSFLTIDDKEISVAQAVKHLQASGKLGQFIGDIIRQNVIEEEIASREDIAISSALTEQAIIDFRLKNQLTDPQRFNDWLKSSGTSYDTFHASVASGFKLERLKAVIAEPKLQEYFIERELAEELQAQIEEGASFEQIAREYSLADDRVVNGMMGPVSRGTLPDILRAAVDVTSPNVLIGPFELEGRFGLFRLEQVLTASLDDTQLKQALQNELFEKWLAEKIQKLTVKLQVG
jgi:PPIC-type PPIASE domain